MKHVPMHMSDYITHLDKILNSTGEKLLEGPGKISHTQAIEKARTEFRKFQNQNLSPVEKAYLSTIREAEEKVKKNR